MSKAILAESLFKVRSTILKRHYNATLAEKIALAFGAACLTGLAAQVRVILPWTPVPVTGQTFTVLLFGFLLGRWWGGLSQAVYLAVGAAGVPWFSGGTGGLQALLGPSAGYLLGFVLAAFFLGHCRDRYYGAKSVIPITVLMFFANFILIHIPGLIVLGIYYYVTQGSVSAVTDLIKLGTLPFLLGDAVKILVAASIAKVLLPNNALDPKN